VDRLDGADRDFDRIPARCRGAASYPAGDWHWLIRSLFIIIVWPALMWLLRPLVKRRVPDGAAL